MTHGHPERSGRENGAARWLEWSALCLIAVCAVVSTVLALERISGTPLPPAPKTELSHREWERVSEKGHRRGAEDAEITIAVFSDFQCPFCKAFAEVADSLLATYADTVSLLFRHLPLPGLHPDANRLATGAECAAQQGRFWQFHDVAFRAQDSIPLDDLAGLAQRVGVPHVSEFIACMGEDASAESVSRDVAEARSLGFRGTPTVIVNGSVVTGARSFARVDSLVRAKLGRNAGR